MSNNGGSMQLMNEALVFARIIIELGVVLGASYLGRTWLYGTIIVNLMLISVLGSQLHTVFGYTTNVGNAPYAAIFFATYLLMERGSIADGIRAIWLGALAVTFFNIITQLTAAQTLVDITLPPRIAAASLMAYLVAQHVNVAMYSLWHERPGGAHWWLKMVSIVLIAQLVDSVIFFGIGFFGAVESAAVFEIMVVGYVVKVLINLTCIPLLYWRVRTGEVTA